MNRGNSVLDFKELFIEIKSMLNILVWYAFNFIVCNTF